MPWFVTRRWGRAAQLVMMVEIAVSLGCTCRMGRAAVVVSRPPSSSGGLMASSWVDPEGSDADQYTYDSFTLSADALISEVRWRGGYLYNATLPNGASDRVRDFRVTFYASVAGDFQPLCGNPHLTETVFLADFWAGNNAGEAPAGSYGGKELYDYAFVPPRPFAAKAGVKYWIKIEGSQGMYPAWGIALGTGENNSHFHFDAGAMRFSYRTGDLAYTLLAPGPDPYTVADIEQALSLCAGLAEPTGDAMARLNVCLEGDSAAVVDTRDAVLLARKVAGIDLNP